MLGTQGEAVPCRTGLPSVHTTLSFVLTGPQDRFSRWQARRARTQRQMNSLWKCPGDLYIAFRQQLVSKWIVLGLMFSSVVPALIPLTFVFFFIANWVDRFNLLRHLAPPPPQDDSIMRQLVQILLPIGVLLHMAVACIAYGMKVRVRGREKGMGVGGCTDHATKVRASRGVVP